MPEITHRDPMEEFANRIVTELEKGVKPWVRPWDPEKAGGPQAPFNPVTGKRYHGVNVLILGMDLRAFQSGDPRWMTYQQAQEKKWQVRKGEKSTTIIFAKPYEVEDDDAEDGKKTIRVLKHYAVFHASPATDHIQLPPEHAFRGPPEFAATALHELGHWTGHRSRLNRDMQSRFGSAAYEMEELRAELASAFVASELGIPTDIPQHASYIAEWIKPLTDDKCEIFRAAADAQKIADIELSFHPAYAAQMRAEPPVAPTVHYSRASRPSFTAG